MHFSALLQFSLFFFIYTELISSKPEPCITPDGENGTCVFIDNCPALLKGLANLKNKTKEFLHRYKCNINYDFVCCTEPMTFATYGAELSDKQYCGYQHSDDYLSDTNKTAIDEFPWLAAILGQHLTTGEEKVICHGSLINNRYVLTAAQCFGGLYTQTYKITNVVLGEYHVRTEDDCIVHPKFGITECNQAKKFGIEKKTLHPFYEPKTGLNDIGLLRLTGSVLFSDYIRPICLPIEGTIFAKPGDILFTTGWGKSPYFENETEVIKKKVEMTLVSHQECRKTSTMAKIPSVRHIICTTESKNNTEFSCGGDAGAPVTFKNKFQWHLEGITSRGGKCGESYPSIHTRVSSYLEWIKQNLQT